MNNKNKQPTFNMSRIPIPKLPLPSLPEHLLNKKRQPLETIHAEQPGPSGLGNQKRTWKSIKLPEKNSHHHLDVYIDGGSSKRDEKNEDVATEENIEMSLNRSGVKRMYNGSEDKLNSPPEKKSKGDEHQPIRVTHIRLQSSKMIKFYSYTMSNTIMDVFEHLLRSETKIIILPKISNWERASLYNWYIKINGADGDPAVIQTTILYLDSYLSTEHLRVKEMRIAAAACFWISQKIHDRQKLLKSKELVACSNNEFDVKTLIYTEEKVMCALKFPSQPVVAHDYIGYLAWWCANDNPAEIEAAATFLCLSGLTVNKYLCCEYPSVIAAASIITALTLLKKSKMLKQIKLCPVYACGKSSYIKAICLIIHKAVRIVTHPMYTHKNIMRFYGTPPYYIAQRLREASKSFAVHRQFKEVTRKSVKRYK